jgi:phosphate transport system regulatory protein PhoU
MRRAERRSPRIGGIPHRAFRCCIGGRQAPTGPPKLRIARTYAPWHAWLVRKDAPEHTSRDFEAELRELRAHLLAMGARCERIVGLGFDAYCNAASQVTQNVVALEAQIDRDELEIHALILRILALRQPLADDLRFLTTAWRLITDLERIGDAAVNIAQPADLAAGTAPHLVIEPLGAMAGAARDMLHLALDAFVRGDDDQASHVAERDDEVDRGCAAVIAAMTAWIP